jgi:hypothetical protein
MVIERRPVRHDESAYIAELVRVLAATGRHGPTSHEVGYAPVKARHHLRELANGEPTKAAQTAADFPIGKLALNGRRYGWRFHSPLVTEN